MQIEHQLQSAFSQIHDPYLQKDIVALGYVQNLKVDRNGRVTLTLVQPTPLFPSTEKIKRRVEQAALSVPGVASADILLYSDIPQGTSTALPNIKNIIAIGSGKGGVGKSTVTVNLAAAFAQYGARVGMIDGDIYGPTVPLMMGTQGETLTQNDRGIVPIEAYGIKFVSMGFLAQGSAPLIWRGPMAHKAVQELLLRVDWGGLDYLFVDMPPGTGDVHLTLVQTVPVTGAVIVTTPQDVGMTISLKTFRMFEQTKVPILGMIENMNAYLCPHCGKSDDIFGSGTVLTEAERLRVPFLGGLPLNKTVRESSDQGIPVICTNPIAASGYVAIADRLATEIYTRQHNKQTLIIEEEPEETAESFSV